MATTIPTTTASTRPSNPSTGDAYFETDTKKYIIYDGTDWRGWNNDGIAAAPLTNTYSVDLDGTDDYVDFGNIGTAGRTLGCMSVWLKTDTAIQSGASGVYGYIIGWGTGSSYNGLRWGFFSASDRLMAVYQGAFVTTWTASSASLGTDWLHMVLNHNGTGYDIYVNGALASDHISGSTLSVSSQSKVTGSNLNGLKIGKAGGGFPTGGLYDEVGLWDDGLTSTQISEIYNSGVPISLSSYSPDGWWRMGDGTEGGSGATIYDMSSNSNNGTIVNGTQGNTTPTYSTSVPS